MLSQACILLLLLSKYRSLFMIFASLCVVLSPIYASTGQSGSTVPVTHIRYLMPYSEFIGSDTVLEPENINSLLEIADNDEATDKKVNACLQLASWCYKLNLFETGAFFAKKGLADTTADDDKEIVLQLLDYLVFNLEASGNLDEATNRLRDLIRMAEAEGNAEWSMYALLRTSSLLRHTGDTERSLGFLNAAGDYLKRINNNYLLLLFRKEQILYYISTNDGIRAADLLEELIDAFGEGPFSEVYGFISLFDNSSDYRKNNEAFYLEKGLNLNELHNDPAKTLWFQKLTGSYLHNINENDRAYEFLKVFLDGKQRINRQHDIEGKQLVDVYNKYLQSKSNDTIQGSNLHPYLFQLISFLLLVSLVTLLFIKIKSLRKRNQIDNDILTEQGNKLIYSIETANDRIEERIAGRKLALESELSERVKVDVELKVALKQAEEANYLKNSFLSNMSHEIRTPLNGILGFSSLLELELAMLDNKELFDYAKSIQESGERLLHLLNNIIDISRIEANDLIINISGHSVNTILNEAIELYTFKANDKGLTVVKKYGDDCLISVDRNTLSRVICEILDNAIKFTEKGFIRVETGLNTNKNRLIIAVRDTGMGIDDTYIPHIFEAFRQESLGYSKLYQGAGLGLPLASRMVELMGGSIRLESQKSVGTTIYLEFAIENEDIRTIKKATEKVSLDGETKGLENLNLFLVEDDVSNMKLLKKMVETVGTTYIANDGEQALKLLTEKMESGLSMDLFLLDINLPAPWDGIKLMQSIKHRYPEYENSPFIAITAYAMTGDRERIIGSGFTDYIPKPLEKATLLKILGNNWQKVKQ